MVDEALALAGEGMQLCGKLRELFTSPRSGATARDGYALTWLADYLDSVVWQEDVVRITKTPEEILGIVWLGHDQLVVQEVLQAHAAFRHGIGDLRGRRLTHVDQTKVKKLAEVRDATAGRGEISLRFAAAAAKGTRRSLCVAFAVARAYGAEARTGFTVTHRQWPLLVQEVCGRDAPNMQEHYERTCSMVNADAGKGIPPELLLRALAEGCGVSETAVEHTLEAAIGFARPGERGQARVQLGQSIGQRFQPKSQALGPEAWATLLQEMDLPEASGTVAGYEEACRVAGTDPRRHGLPSHSLVHTLAKFPLQSSVPHAEAGCLVVLLRALVRRLTASATHPPPVPYPIFPSRWGLAPELRMRMAFEPDGPAGAAPVTGGPLVPGLGPGF